ncbi:MAG: hypothetical protein EOO50_00655 [Flavobacterium sp.]|uniref:hypothetical protein n=1 Tax=Flavobacterium sp. TaxID=239 RepID=UPI0011F4A8A4|nr:hypothetical protein [Flavobacterium sp.]RZJ68721.1 MAG: hypothetical protein EOO50_00655 [Flavobacterium sp.]
MKHLIRMLLKIALVLAATTALLKFSVGPAESIGFNYFSVFISLFILLFSFVVLLILVLKNMPNRETWEELKPEILLFFAAVGMMVLAGVIN